MPSSCLPDRLTDITLIDLLRMRAFEHPDQQAFLFLDVGDQEQSVTYHALHTEACAIASTLQRMLTQGERVLICCPQGLEYIKAYFGCIYAGMVAVPAYPPSGQRLQRTLPRLQAIVANAQAALALTTEATLADHESILPAAFDQQPLRWIAIESCSGAPQAMTEPPITSHDLAMLMYTSGSTATPKGVMVSHGNVLHNAQMFPGFAARPPRMFVSWLPLHHDLGLFMGIIHPLYQGVPVVLFDSQVFIQQPFRWLQAISDYQATTSGGPNFAYELCCRKISSQQRAKLDLSAWTLALNGAEPINPRVLEQFTADFGACGFRSETFYPSYGMSDATATVSGAFTLNQPQTLTVQRRALEQNHVRISEPGPLTRTLVGCGQSLADQSLIIVDPATHTRCQADEVGEIWLSGPSVPLGYWNQHEATAHTFQATLATGEGPFFRTGDLGFLDDGEVYVTGRLKDVIIIRGQNHYPEDIEHTVGRCNPQLRAGNGVAFGVETQGEERIVVVYEVQHAQAAFASIYADIQQAVAEQHHLRVDMVVLIEKGSVPKTSSGKLARQQAKQAFLTGQLQVIQQFGSVSSADPPLAGTDAPSTTAPARTVDNLQRWLINWMAKHLKLTPNQIDIHAPFARYGLDSLQSVTLAADFGQWLGRTLAPTLVWDYPSIDLVARTLSRQVASTSGVYQPQEQHEAIAIIGMACRFPGAPNLHAFWQLLCEGGDAISEIPDTRWDWQALYDPDRGVPGKMYGRWGGFLAQPEYMDAAFFGVSPREAAHIDPQQRLLMECAWEALEDAGIPPPQLANSHTGVFVASVSDDYARILFSHPEVVDAYTGPGSAHSILANRLSYLLDLQGPSVAVNTACSGGLVAIHMACQALSSGEAALSIAGGVNVNLLPDGNIFFSKAGALSPDGRCKAFDARANGIVRSDGAGVVVLKPLRQALADGNPIYAVIRGSAVNSDGRTNGIMAPSRQSQEAVLREAYHRARVAPGQVQYVETHGTGTSLGDVIEAQALGAVLAEDRPADQACRIGSVKTNIGHTESAAGLAGIIKVALSLNHQVLPPTVHFQTPNPMIPFHDLRLRVQDTLETWTAPSGARFSGVSSFGFGGTNAHVVLEAAPHDPTPAAPAPDAALLLPLSAHTPKALHQRAEQYLDVLRHVDQQRVADVCYTAAVGRTHHDHRLAISATHPEQLVERLEAVLGNNPTNNPAVSNQPSSHQLVWVFSGQGSHWLGMGRTLLSQPVFRATMEACDRILRTYDEWSLLDELQADAATSRLDATERTQPAIFAVQVSLAALWRSWGITPAAVVGQSLGEVAAAHVTGILSLEDALHVVYHRSQLMQQVAGKGKTAAVGLSLDQARMLLVGRDQHLAIAGSNSPTSCILSGDPAELEAIVTSLQQRDVFARMVQGVDIAFHSHHMDPLLPEFQAALAQLSPQPPRVPLVSTVTGQFVGTDTLTCDVAYWGRNLREPFLFSTAVQTLLDQGFTSFLEISPHPVLLESLLRHFQHAGASANAFASLRRNCAELETLFETLGAFYVAGEPIQWQAVYAEARPFVSLPAYPWQRERYWYDQLLKTAPETSEIDQPSARGSFVPTLLASTDPSEQAHPLLGSVLHSSVASQHFWQTTISSQHPGYIADHIVQQQVLMPGSGYIEMMAAALRSMGSMTMELRNVTFKRPLVLSEASQTIQTVWTEDTAQTRTFQILSQQRQEPRSWELHATATVGTEPQSWQSLPLAIADIKARCKEEISQTTHYARMHDTDLTYGPAFQAVTQVWRRDGEALASLSLPAVVGKLSDHDILHPVLLDAAFQAVAHTLPQEAASQTYVPISIKRMHIRTTLPTQGWCHATFLEAAMQPASRTWEADVRIADSEGVVIAEIQGLRLYQMDAIPAHREHDSLATYTWQPMPPTTISNQASERWLILTDQPPLGQELAATLATYGQLATVAEHQPDPADLAAFNPWLQALLDQQYQHLVCLWPRSDHAQDAPPVAAVRQTRAMLHVLQALHTAEGQPPRLWCITQGAQPIASESTQAQAALAQAPLWGLLRTAALEHPEWHATLLDVDPMSEPPNLEAVANILHQRPAEHQLALRAGQLLVARLQPAAPTDVVAPLRWSTEGAYLITGGSGGLGFAMARWMIEQGARHLIIIGRTPLPCAGTATDPEEPAAHTNLLTALSALEATGADVQYAAVDSTDETALAAFVDTYHAQGGPPIRGVVHAAGVLQDALIYRLDTATLEQVLAPKIAGAWALHRTLRDEPLEFMVFCSSLAAAIGSVGQAHYAAGNAFMDALAHYRRSEGLPALSVNWGPWASVGMASRLDPTMFAAQGVALLETQHALDVLEKLVVQQVPQAIVARIDWQRWLDKHPAAKHLPFYRALAPTSAQPEPVQGEASQTQTLHTALQQATPEQRQEVLEQTLQPLVGTVLRSDPTMIYPETPLHTFGFDSIMSIELNIAIERSIGATLSVAYLVQGPSITEIATKLLQQMVFAPENLEEMLAAPATSEEALPMLLEHIEQGDPTQIARLLAELEDLSADEVKARLSE